METNENRPPLNFEPADGVYTFRVGKIKETDVRKSAKGTGYVKVALIGTELTTSQFKDDEGNLITVTGNAYVKTTFFATPKALGKAYDLITAAGGAKPTTPPADEFGLADCLHAVSGKFVKATIKKGEPREWNGKTYTDYEVGSFTQPF